MKILYYFKEINTPMYQWQRFHIFNELKFHNCNIEVFNPLNYNSTEDANECLLNYVKKSKFNLFMTPHNEKDIFIDTLKKIKSLGIQTLLICFDNLVIPYHHKKICKFFDLVWLTSVETINMFKVWGANTIFLPYASNPYFLNYIYKVDEIHSIVFLGTPYGTRVKHINNLIKNNINITLYSNIDTNINFNKNNFNSQKLTHYIYPGFNLMRFRVGRNIIRGYIKNKLSKNHILDLSSNNLNIVKAVNLDCINNIYSSYALSLSTTEARNTGCLNTPIDIVNLRCFEIPMSGGIQICRYIEELANYFEEDKEIIFYRSDEEFIEKCNFYLKSENKYLRDKIRISARRRAENEHTWFCRFKKVFDYFGLKY